MPRRKKAPVIEPEPEPVNDPKPLAEAPLPASAEDIANLQSQIDSLNVWVATLMAHIEAIEDISILQSHVNTYRSNLRETA